MNTLIMFPLMCILLCAVTAKALNIQNIEFQQTQPYQINNGSSTGTTYDVPSIDFIGLDGLLALLIVFIGIGVAAGVTVFGTGISTSAQNIIYKSTFFYSLWGIFSALGGGFVGGAGIISIPIFGTLLYIFLTILYVVGVQSQINTHEG